MSLNHGGYGIPSETFQQIIRERKVEQKERVKKVIRARNLVNHNKDEMIGNSPLELFPAELWELILYELHDAKDHKNVWEANGLFRKLDKGAFLLQKLDLEAPRICSRHKEPCHCPSGRKQKGTFAQYLKLRTLSKTLRSGIDLWYEKNLLGIMREGRNDYGLIVPSLYIGCSDQRMRKAFKHFGKEGVQRVFTRSVTLQFSTFGHGGEDDYMNEESEDFNMFKRESAELFRIIGNQIWHFKCSFDEFDEDAYVNVKGIYICLTKLISFMPNLKWLEMDIGRYEKYWGRREENLMTTTLFQEHPFPRLKDLERISIRYFAMDSDVVNELLNVNEAIISANSHVKILDFSGDFDVPLGLLPESDDLIQSLQLNSFALGGGDRCSVNCEELMTCINKNWPLKRIQFGADSVKDALNLLEKFPTLEVVSLHLFDVSDFEDVPFLKLPNLTEFECEVCPRIKSYKNLHFFFSLQFLLYSKKLRELTWKYDLQTFAEDKELDCDPFCLNEKVRRYMVNYEKHESMINFRAGMRDLKFSNIWDVYPEMKHFKVGFKSEDNGEWVMKTYRRG